ncbi:MAG: AmmeMemoRadiSam system protein B [Chloroflexota bacterium]|nr:AmmeMemoRadiSam system protein B [Chloroflexota bacterium]
MTHLTDPRPSPLAGRWYSGDPKTLAKSVDKYIADAEIPEIPGEILAVVAPHAGHRYSGPVAGYAFAALRGLTPDLVVIASPMHQPYLETVLTSAHEGYRTPLGDVPINREIVQEIAQTFQAKTGIEIVTVRNDREHSIEIELPFLQRVFSHPFQIVPLMIRNQEPQTIQELGKALASALESRNAIMVASTDLSHFYPAHVAETLDKTIIQAITALNPEAIFQAEREKKGFACGKGALAAVIWAAKALGANKAHHLHYAHSGAVTGDTREVVGYTAAVITRD